MEKDGISGQGTARVISEKLYEDSDYANIYVCRVCKTRAVVNEKSGLYLCKICGDDADITVIESSWVANVFFNEAAAMNVNMTFELEKFMFSRQEE